MPRSGWNGNHEQGDSLLRRNARYAAVIAATVMFFGLASPISAGADARDNDPDPGIILDEPDYTTPNPPADEEDPASDPKPKSRIGWIDEPVVRVFAKIRGGKMKKTRATLHFAARVRVYETHGKPVPRGGSARIGKNRFVPLHAVTYKKPKYPRHLRGNKRLGYVMMTKRWGVGQWRCLHALWSKESNWNHQAKNRYSGAYGIPQSLPGRKMASAGRDWQTNPATQIKWGLRYIAKRYNSPCGAWGHFTSVNWY